MFVDRDGIRHDIKGKIGDNVLYLAHRYGIELEGMCICVCMTTQDMWEILLQLALICYVFVHVCL